TDAIAAGGLRASRSGGARYGGGVHQCRPPARVGVRPRPHRGQNHPVRRRSRTLRPPGTAGSQPVDEADVLLVESTYGDRVHEPDDDGAHLAAVVNETAARGGKLIVPAFAVGRVEEVLYWLRRLELASRIPMLPVYVDSPMATRAVDFYSNRTEELDPDIR